MFSKQGLNSSKVLNAELLNGGKHGFAGAENMDHKVAENESRLYGKAMGDEDDHYIENK